MSIDHFFSPMSPWNIFQALIIFGSFEAIGFWFAKKFQLSEWLRQLYWLIGLSVYIGLWFVLGWFTPYSTTSAWVTLLGLSIYPNFYYVKHLGFISLIKSVLAAPWIWLFILIIGKNLLYIINLPPYAWDEMAYHYISPYQLRHLTTWSYHLPNFYNSQPQFMDLSYRLSFALTKTYVYARLIHLLIFLTALSTITSLLIKKMGHIVAIVFSFLVLFLNLDILTNATTGYIDAAGSVLAVLSLIGLLPLIVKPSWDHLKTSVVLITLALSIKYTALPLVISGLITTGVFITLWHGLKFKSNSVTRKELLTISSLIIILGGFWYLKNLVFFQNPFYPFDPLHTGHIDPSAVTYFSTWTIPFNQNNITTIMQDLTQNHQDWFVLLPILLLLTAFIGRVKRHSFTQVIAIFLPLVIVLEVFLNINMSGYYHRMFYHWRLLLPLFLALPFSLVYNNHSFKQKVSSFLILLGATGLLITTNVYATSLKNINTFNHNNEWANRGYSYLKRNISLAHYLTWLYPSLHQVVADCGQAKQSPQPLIVADPAIIWSKQEGLIRVYLTNCYFYPLDLDFNKPVEILAQEIQALNIPVVSLTPCQDKPNPYLASDQKAIYYEVNQLLVCHN